MTRLDQSKNNGKIPVRILPGVLVLQTYRRFLRFVSAGYGDAKCLKVKMNALSVRTVDNHENFFRIFFTDTACFGELLSRGRIPNE